MGSLYYKLVGTGLTLDGPISKPEIDTGRMSARCIFATGSWTVGGDVLNVWGIDTTAHRKNPVVLFDHAKWFSGCSCPVVAVHDDYPDYPAVKEACHSVFHRPPDKLVDSLAVYLHEGSLRLSSCSVGR
jgi:hypothetical protein